MKVINFAEQQTVVNRYMSELRDVCIQKDIWGIERSGFFNGREKWAKGFENQRV